MAFLYGRAGRLTAKNAGFRPGQFINASGKAMMIENSNQGFGNPQRGACKGNMQCPGCNNSVVKDGCGRGNPNNTLAPGWCPYNMFRTCGDIGPDFGGVMGRLGRGFSVIIPLKSRLYGESP
jgi:hypothetical protein